MLKQTIRKTAPVALLLFAVISLAAWQQRPSAPPKPPKPLAIDTIPDRNNKIKDIDDAIQQLDKSQQDMERSFNDIKIPPVPPVPPIPPIEPEKIKAEVDKAMKSIDVEKMKAEIEKSVKEIDVAKLKAETNAAMAKVDWEKMKKEMERVKEEMPKVEAQLKDLKPQIEKSMQEAKVSIEKARKELQGYKTFIDQLAQDGLINKNENYTIEHKNGSLIINGKTQSAEVYNKYRSYLPQQKNFTIKKDNEGFNIHNDKGE